MNHPMQVKPATNEPKLSPFGKLYFVRMRVHFVCTGVYFMSMCVYVCVCNRGCSN